MKKFLIAIAALVVFGYLGGFIAWWSIALIAMIVGFILQMNGPMSFTSGLLGGALFFGIYITLLDSANESMLYNKMNTLLKFDSFMVAVLIGALLAAMGMLTGKYLRDVALGENKPRRHRGKYS